MPASKRQDDKEDEGGDGEEKLTVDSVRKMIADALNATANGVVKAAIKKIDFGSMITEAAKTLKSSKSDEEGEEGESGAAKGKAPGVPDELAARFAELESENKRNKKLFEDERKKNEAERTTRLANEERSAITDALVKGGADKALVQAARALLLHEEKRTKRGADGALRFLHDEEEHDVEPGVAKWLATDQGKRFMPAKDVGGSGAQGSGAAVGTDGKPKPLTLAQLGVELSGIG